MASDYLAPSRQQQIDILHQQILFNRDTLCIIGEKGCGKSTLLKQFIHRGASLKRFAAIQARAQLSVGELFQKITHTFNFDIVRVDPQHLVEGFRRHLEQEHYQGQAIIFIDDAEELNDDVLEAVLHLSQMESSEGELLLRLVMFAAPTLCKRLDQQRTPYQLNEIAPFNEPEGVAFLEHIVDHTRINNQSQKLSQKQIRAIVQQIGGNPLQLKKALEEGHQGSGLTDIVSTWQFWLGISSLVGVIVILILPTSGSDINDQLKSAETGMSLNVTNIDKKIGSSRPLVDPSSQGDIDLNPQPVLELADEKRVIVSDSTLSSIAVKPIEKIVPMKKVADSAFKIKSVSNPDKDIESATVSDGGEWLRSQSKTNYTNQLLASGSLAGVHDFVRAKGLKGQFYTLATLSQGRRIYILVSGSYLSKESAQREAVSRFSGMKAWSRPIQGLLPLLTGKVDTPLVSAPISAITALTHGGEVRDAAWVWSQDPTQYTLQLLAASERSKLELFIRQNSTEKGFAIVQSQRQNAPWYLLLYGSYADRDRAKKALINLSHTLRKGGAWARSYASLHDELGR